MVSYRDAAVAESGRVISTSGQAAVTGEPLIAAIEFGWALKRYRIVLPGPSCMKSRHVVTARRPDHARTSACCWGAGFQDAAVR